MSLGRARGGGRGGQDEGKYANPSFTEVIKKERIIHYSWTYVVGTGYESVFIITNN